MSANVRQRVEMTLAIIIALVILAAAGGAVARAQTPSAASQPATRQTPAAPTGDPTKGKQLFQTYFCHSCHGTEGQGGAGPHVAPNPAAFNVMRNYLRKPAGSMPPYSSKALPEADLADIYAYLKSIPPVQASKNIPLLNQ
jgi:mono/diheme cytochrome c family protein